MFQDVYSENKDLAQKISSLISLLLKGKKVKVPEGYLLLTITEEGTPIFVLESNELQMPVDSCMWILSALSKISDSEISKLISENIIVNP